MSEATVGYTAPVAAATASFSTPPVASFAAPSAAAAPTYDAQPAPSFAAPPVAAPVAAATASFGAPVGPSFAPVVPQVDAQHAPSFTQPMPAPASSFTAPAPAPVVSEAQPVATAPVSTRVGAIRGVSNPRAKAVQPDGTPAPVGTDRRFFDLDELMALIDQGRVVPMYYSPQESPKSSPVDYKTLSISLTVTDPDGTKHNRLIAVRLPQQFVSIGRTDPVKIAKADKTLENGIKNIDTNISQGNIQTAITVASASSLLMAYLLGVHKDKVGTLADGNATKPQQPQWLHYMRFNPETDEGKLVERFFAWLTDVCAKAMDMYKGDVGKPQFDIKNPTAMMRSILLYPTNKQSRYNPNTNTMETIEMRVPGSDAIYRSKKFGAGISAPVAMGPDSYSFRSLTDEEYAVHYKKNDFKGHPVIQLRDVFVSPLMIGVRSFLTLNVMDHRPAQSNNVDEIEAIESFSQMTEEQRQAAINLFFNRPRGAVQPGVPVTQPGVPVTQQPAVPITQQPAAPAMTMASIGLPVAPPTQQPQMPATYYPQQPAVYAQQQQYSAPNTAYPPAPVVNMPALPVPN